MLPRIEHGPCQGLKFFNYNVLDIPRADATIGIVTPLNR